MTSPDYEGLAELLLSLESETDSHPQKGRRLVNPDGPEAARDIRHLVAERDRLEDSVSGLLAFIGQMTPEQFVDALYRLKTPGLELTTREHLKTCLDAALAAAWSSLAALSGRKEP